MIRTICIIVIAGLGVIPGLSQLRWTNVSHLYTPLPASVQVYLSTDSVDGKPNRCFYISADLSDKQLQFTTQVGNGKRLTPTQFYTQENQPLLVVNGTFFSFADNRNLNAVIHEGKLVAYNVPSVKGKNDSLYRYITRGALGISKKGKPDVAWLFTDTSSRYPLALEKAPSTLSGFSPDATMKFMKKELGRDAGAKKWKMETAIAGGSVLLHNGQIKITNNEERMFVNGEKDRHPRTAMGYTADGKLMILMTEGRNPGIAEGMTLQQQAETLLKLGCVEALNLDGGGSSCLLLNGKETIKTSDKDGQRAVPAVFMIYSQ